MKPPNPIVILCVVQHFLCTLVHAFRPSRPVTSVGKKLSSTNRSIINGLLAIGNLNPRQEEEYCPIAGGITCNSVYCCEPGTFCEPNNPRPRTCCSSSIGMSCNGGTACCDRELEKCCTTDPSGCCLLDESLPNPTPSATISNPPTPTDTRVPKGTIALDYQDMLRPRKKDQDPNVRKQAVDSLFKNMCLGMQKRNTLGTQTEIFTYTRSQQSANRRAACGGVKCSSGESCDEFPFASTAEGGSNAIANCILSLGNSIQGGFLGSLLKENDIQEDEHYELQLSSVDCTELLGQPRERRETPALNARQQEESGLTPQMQRLQMLDFGPFAQYDINNHSVYFIGDLGSGRYSVEVQVDDGIVDEFYIVDYQGFSYASSQNLRDQLDPPLSLSFSLPEDAVGVTLLLSFSIDYNISSRMTTGVAGSSSISSPVTRLPTETTTPSLSGALNLALDGFTLGGCFLTVVTTVYFNLFSNLV